MNLKESVELSEEIELLVGWLNSLRTWTGTEWCSKAELPTWAKLLITWEILTWKVRVLKSTISDKYFIEHLNYHSFFEFNGTLSLSNSHPYRCCCYHSDSDGDIYRRYRRKHSDRTPQSEHPIIHRLLYFFLHSFVSTYAQSFVRTQVFSTIFGIDFSLIMASQIFVIIIHYNTHLTHLSHF